VRARGEKELERGGGRWEGLRGRQPVTRLKVCCHEGVLQLTKYSKPGAARALSSPGPGPEQGPVDRDA
jgi:hypothetical protein